jgi:hypothetical protein
VLIKFSAGGYQSFASADQLFSQATLGETRVSPVQRNFFLKRHHAKYSIHLHIGRESAYNKLIERTSKGGKCEKRSKNYFNTGE